ncbi:MAG: hypothetical protein ACOCVL_00165 [Candidatus Sumerlaeota bacterium]
MHVLKPILENLGERIAAANGGRIYPAQILPCLPVSLEMISDHLDGMVDDAVVFRHENDGLVYYEFSELVGGEIRPLATDHCVHCSESVDPADQDD